ncbi:putative bifunctional diguanylate cyclase/phosphodiesterase [Geodermatophilus nigrescens]|uniref:PAS domain S-box-containing protein/diguanylate cyclase (GGDEF) domain-containing protein n=1 Tax=Geodermatophilus nigrescens TaxID=1070870 RepID=A0A1M5ESY8_9ACTN|nr:EAL domain-containing protein [Geodermatophilus nigrescens]SHF82254.1 PAS domain S-box-containing protein/diguanylate cyclase (GGDEF) domain-containing protein [Geodermatophilus nigrescens]
MSTISVRPGPTVPPALLRRGAVGAAAVVTALLLWVQAAHHGTGLATAIYFAVIGATVVAAWAGVRRGGSRPAAVCIAVGVALSAVADVVWQLQVSLTGSGSDAGPADVVYLGSYVALATGLSLLARRSTSDRDQRVAGWIDALVVFVAVLVVVWELSVAATVGDESLTVLTRLTLALYPAMDAALIGLVVRLLATRRQGDRTPLAVAAACACWLASDLAYLLDSDAEGFGGWLDSGWLLGSALLAVAAWPLQTAPGPSGAAEESRSGLARLVVCLSALMVPPSMELFLDLTGGVDASGTVFASMLVLTSLVFVRAALLLRGEAAARALLRSRERHAAKLTAHSSDAVLVVARDGRLLNDAAPLSALLGTPATRLVTSGDAVALAGVDPQLAADLFAQALVAEGAVVDAEIPVRHRGEERWISVRLTDLSGDPDVGGVVVHVTDVTGRRRAEDALAHSVLHDGLTGLANRTLFADRVGQALRRTVRGGGSAAVVSVDVDGFKAVNDGLGHAAGDALLREVAARLRAAVRADDTVARIGGDEFAVLVEQTGDDEAVATAARVREVLAAPMTLAGAPVTVTASVGVAVGRGDVGAESLIGDADLALYAAKLDGRDRMKTFTPCMRAQAREARELEQELRGALDGGEFRLVYQPVVGLGDRRVTGFEALLRWDSPRLGPVGPDRFVPVAEAAGLMDAIGSWVLREACATAAAWLRDHAGAGELSMAVNVSATQLGSPDLVASIAAALAESGLPARCLVLEVTETALVGDPERAAACLAALRALGVRLALDDFGTGYSSLAHLRQFTVDVLKIDRSFVSGIAEGEPLPAIVRGTIDLGRTLGLEVLAEGVEHEHQARLLAEGCCDTAQGYLFAKPLERTDAEALLLEQAAVRRPQVPAPRSRVGQAVRPA